MRLLLLLLLSVCPSWGTWALIQHPNTTLCTAGTTCNLTVTSTGTGHVLIGVLLQATTTAAISSVSGGGTWVHPASCSASDTNGGSVDVAYVLSSTSGTTTITVTSTKSFVSQNGVWEVGEYSFTASPAVFDACGTPASRTTGTTIAGAAISLTGTNDVIIQAIGCGQTCSTSATGGFVGATPWLSPNDFPGGDGVGGSINTSSTTAPNWAQSPTATAAVTAIAIKETSAAGASPGVKAKKLIKIEGQS